MKHKGPHEQGEAPLQKPSQHEERQRHKTRQGTQSLTLTDNQILVLPKDAGLGPLAISTDKAVRIHNKKKHRKSRRKGQGYTQVKSVGHPPEVRWKTDWMMGGTWRIGERGKPQLTTSK